MTKQILILVCAAAVCLPLIIVGCDTGSVERVELGKVKVELEKLKIEHRKVTSERDSLKAELAAATKSRDELRQQVARLTGEQKKLRDQEQKELRDQIQRLTGSNQSLSQKVTALTGSVDQLDGQLKKVTDSRDRLQKDNAELKTSRDQLQTQVKELTKQRDEAVAKELQARGEIVALTAKLQAAAKVSRGPQTDTGSIVEAEEGEGLPEVEAAAGPTIHSFDAARTTIGKGQNTTLSWHVSNADSITIEPDVGSVSALGSTNVKPPKTTTYTLTATNAAGEITQTRTIKVR
ncbi:MAG: hypothetical protein ACYSWO_16125 [Planctomycetota bacterium]|jgi:cell division septum initiation protein DivIVA